MLARLPGSSRYASLTVVGLVATAVYLNTLIGDFTFDDNFAVINNGDVTNSAIPVADLFKHDFWGQDITSPQSHKSYRPLTVLAFRLTHRLWCLLTAVAPALPALLPRPPPVLPGAVDEGSKPDRPAGLHPFPYHVLCVALHAISSMLVAALFQHMFAVLERGHRPEAVAAAATPECSNNSTARQRHGCRQGWSQALLMWDSQPLLWQVPQAAAYRAQAMLAGLMFALHPIHTEAVAGIVGCAELVCTALSCPALLLYFMAVDGRFAAAQQLQQQPGASSSPSDTSASSRPGQGQAAGSVRRPKQAAFRREVEQAGFPTSLLVAGAVQHWSLVLAAAALALCAALSKEIGITVIGTMLVYDLLAPQQQPQQKAAGVAGGCTLQPMAARRQLLRMTFVGATALGYVLLRQRVAGQHLVTIYRKVENPIPFAESCITRALSTAYLHARYAGLLLVPLHLSADWSFNCIPLVETWADPRNLASLALYGYCVYTLWAAQPHLLLQQLWALVKVAAGWPAPAAFSGVCGRQGRSAPGCSAATAEGQAAAAVPGTATGRAAGQALAAYVARSRWRLLVLVGLVIAPFFPASNVLFYVGTFIGERLLYMPSIGFCLLVADLLGPAQAGEPQALHRDPQQQQQQQEDALNRAGQPAEMGGSEGAGQGPQPQQPPGSGGQQSPGSGRQQVPAGHPKQQAPGNKGLVRSTTLVLCALLLAAYAGKTLLRNQDWWDEERLFLSALKVCPNSAKVQQNSGVLYRRFKDYAAALQHFRRAQEIVPEYCEPTYWIGLTLFNQGDLQTGVSTMKASLSCKYTAAEALGALNKVYLLLMDAGKGSDPAPMLEWAGVLTSPYVLRIPDACATAEDAALGAALAGKGAQYVARAIHVCLEGIQRWQQGPIQPDTLASLTRQRLSHLNMSQLAECVGLRQPVYKKLAGNTPGAPAVRRAVYKYILRVSQQAPNCRTLEGGGPLPLDNAPDSSVQPSSHQKLIHKVQAADPEDPWLQAEWGLTLLALQQDSLLQQARLHLEVAAAMFTRAAQELMAAATPPGGGRHGGRHGAGAGGGGPEDSRQGRPGGHVDARGTVSWTQLDSKTALTPVTALQAAAQPLEAFRVSLDSSGALSTQECTLLQRLCHIRLQMVAALQHEQQQGTQQGMQQVLGDAMLAGRQCLKDLSQRPGCGEQAAALRKMVGL